MSRPGAPSGAPLRLSGGDPLRPESLRRILGVPFSEAQLAAATAPLEPGVVVAGAGSGKTSVMAARVVWLVLSGQVTRGQVLGLTFTNKAAGELASRVRVALATAASGWRPAAGVRRTSATGLAAMTPEEPTEPEEPTVSTYHAYAGRLVREHGLRAGVEPRSQLLADASRYQLAHRVLRRARGPIRSLTKPVRMLVEDLVALDAELAEHLVDPDDVRAHDEALIAEIASLARSTKEVQNVAESARKRIELCRLVEDLRLAKADLMRLDFGDQVAVAARLGEQHPEVGAAERSLFRVVLLDEYQDTSVAQRRMLTGLFGLGHPVTAVGDPCQSVYGWRGASVANLDDFPTQFPLADGTPAARYALVENRRSGASLLELANRLAAPLQERHRMEPLVPGADRMGSGDVLCALLPSYDEEIAWAADQVSAALYNGVPAAQVAVLVRARSDFPALYAALTARSVPVEVVGLGGLLELPEVSDLVATLEVLDDATSNAALVRLLTGARWRIGHRDLALLGRRARDLVRGTTSDLDGSGAPSLEDLEAITDAALEEAVSGVDPSEVVSLSDALERPGGAPYSAVAAARFQALADELRGLRAHLHEPLLDLLHRILETTGLGVEIAASPAAVAARRLDNLAAFLDQAAAFVDLDGQASVSSFLAFLAAADEWERGLDTIAPTSSDAVKLMTAHKAKGLEWDVVVLPDLTRGVFPSTRGRAKWTANGHVLPYPLRGDYGSGLPSVPAWSVKGLQSFTEQLRAHTELEETRLGYVAVTRARDRLVASGHWWGPTQKLQRGPSPFLEAVRAHCAAGNGTIARWAPEPTEEDNPHLDIASAAAIAAMDLDPGAVAERRRVAALVGAAASAGDPAAWTPEAPGPRDDLDPAGRALVESWDRDAALLLDEARSARRSERTVTLPGSLSTSDVLELAAAPDQLASRLARPMPRRPSRSASRGTRFHAWVEERFAQQPLLDPDELAGAGDAGATDDADLDVLRRAFLRTPFADVAPHAVEAPFSLVVAGRVVRGRIDAVYATAGGFDVIDWKTGTAEAADPLQLAVYRLAWAELQELPAERVGAAFLYVRTGRLVRPDRLPGRADLERLLGGGGPV